MQQVYGLGWQTHPGCFSCVIVFFLFFCHFYLTKNLQGNLFQLVPWVTFCLSKSLQKMDPIFEHPVFDSAREKMKWQLEKSKESFENLLHNCFKCGSNNVFSIAKQVRSAVERICTLFREQGITIFTILTALSMNISTIFFAITGGVFWRSGRRRRRFYSKKWRGLENGQRG